MTSQDAETLDRYLEEGFRRVQLADIKQADECEVRAGTFVLCAAFIDALALAYGYESGATSDEGKWNVFVGRFFSTETRTALRGHYEGFRCMLLHDFSASGFALTHGRPELHLKVKNGLTVLNREDFVAEVEAAFERFRAEVTANDELGQRALEWLTLRPPIGLWLVADTDAPTSLADSFTAARLGPATAPSAVGNGLQFLVADTARLGQPTPGQPTPGQPTPDHAGPDHGNAENGNAENGNAENGNARNDTEPSNATAPPATKKSKKQKNKRKHKKKRREL